MANLLSPRAEPPKTPGGIFIRRPKGKVTIKQTDQPVSSRNCSTIPRNIITIQGVNSSGGPPNIQINYHTYINNYPGCVPYQYQSKPVVVVDEAEKSAGPKTLSVLSPSKLKSSFADKLHKKVQLPEDTCHLKFYLSNQAHDPSITKKRIKLKLNGEQCARQVTVLKEGTPTVADPSLRNKLFKHIRRAYTHKNVTGSGNTPQ